MPTEHEYKYMISLDVFKKYDHEALVKISDKFLRIKQGYLAFSKGMTARVRCIEDGSKTKWYYTFKQKVSNRVIEIEAKIDKRDGTDLWKIAIGRLSKHRYVINHEGLKWEFDLFWKGDHLYFAMAEVELDEGSPAPDTMPSFLEEFLLHRVDLDDDRFSNKRLSDVEFATNLYKKTWEN